MNNTVVAPQYWGLYLKLCDTKKTMKVWSFSVPQWDHHCHCEYLEKKIILSFIIGDYYIIIDHRQVLVYHKGLDEEDAGREGKEKRVYPKQNLAAAEPKQTEWHWHVQ